MAWLRMALSSSLSSSSSFFVLFVCHQNVSANCLDRESANGILYISACFRSMDVRLGCISAFHRCHFLFRCTHKVVDVWPFICCARMLFCHQSQSIAAILVVVVVTGYVRAKACYLSPADVSIRNSTAHLNCFCFKQLLLSILLCQCILKS